MNILDLPMKGTDTPTIRAYLVLLLETLWREGEGFSGKRPLGNSGWQYDLYKPLLAAGLVAGTCDVDGYINRIDEKEASRLILEAIRSLRNDHSDAN